MAVSRETSQARFRGGRRPTTKEVGRLVSAFVAVPYDAPPSGISSGRSVGTRDHPFASNRMQAHGRVPAVFALRDGLGAR